MSPRMRRSTEDRASVGVLVGNLIQQPDKLGNGVDPQLVHHTSAVNLYGLLADAERFGNLPVQQTIRDKRRNLALARRERGKKAPRLRPLLALVQRVALCASARRTVSSSSVRSTGLSRNSNAPCFIASTDTGTLPFPVRKMMGSVGSFFSLR